MVQEAVRKRDLEMYRMQHRTALDLHDALPEHPAGLDPAEESQHRQRRAAANEQLSQLAIERNNLLQQISLLEPDANRAQRQLDRLQQVGTRRLQARLYYATPWTVHCLGADVRQLLTSVRMVQRSGISAMS